MVATRKAADRREYLNVLYYGDGGTGKTTALASMANSGRVLYIDAEAGFKARALAGLGVNIDNVEFPDWASPTWQEMDDIFWQVKGELDEDPDSWFGVVWDSGSEIARALLDNVVDDRVTKANRAGSRATELAKDPFFVEQDNWGTMTQQFRRYIRRFRDLPCNFGISFLERRDKEKDGSVRVGPAINPGLQSDVVGWHDVVCRTSVIEGAYIGTTRPEGIRMGKDRYNVLPFAMVNPSVERMLAYIAGDLTADTDPLQNPKVEPAPTDSEDDDEQEASGPAPAKAKAKASPLDRAKAAAARKTA